MADLAYFVTVRSPYSYLSVARVAKLAKTPEINLVLKPVYPLAIRAPEFFSNGNPLLLNYLRRDAERVAEMQGQPFAWPNPDPVLQDLKTSEIAKDQPHIHFLTRLLAAACEEGEGFEFYKCLSALIFDGCSSWNSPRMLTEAAVKAGLSYEAVKTRVETDPQSLDAQLSDNAKHLEGAGHWGTPSLKFKYEIFFGQDRIEMCAWYMQNSGYAVDI